MRLKHLCLYLCQVQTKLESLLGRGERDATKAELRAQSATLAAAHTLQQQQQEAYDWAQHELGNYSVVSSKYNWAQHELGEMRTP